MIGPAESIACRPPARSSPKAGRKDLFRARFRPKKLRAFAWRLPRPDEFLDRLRTTIEPRGSRPMPREGRGLEKGQKMRSMRTKGVNPGERLATAGTAPEAGNRRLKCSR